MSNGLPDETVINAHGHSQPQRSHQCVAGPLGTNKIPNRKKIGLMEQRGVNETPELSVTGRTVASCPATQKGKAISPPVHLFSARFERADVVKVTTWLEHGDEWSACL
ncbi:hypothetical protein EVAR_18299_1 [Eumeta japonica]|uniref:Uncharacterized protein n=1 Tax=Eumeta variegata TaxID=151549 RepID=A0A4C1VB37_EUMVA|nr:hypothetical protein EVAR_18299_1 [Eumeta japonica]